MRCGFKHPAAIDFHHRDPKEKEFTVSQMLRRGKTEKQMLKEIAKCDTLCANCHRIHHHDEKHGPMAQMEEKFTQV